MKRKEKKRKKERKIQKSYKSRTKGECQYDWCEMLHNSL